MDAQTVYPWEAHYPEGIDWREHFTGRPLYTLLDEAVKQWPDNIALEFLGRTYRYRELHEMVNRLARGLQQIGVKPGTRVGLLMPNCPQYVMHYYAIMKAGGTVVNFNPLYSKDEVSYQLKDANVEVMATVNLRITYDKLVPFIGQGSLRKVIVCPFQDAMGFPKNKLFALARHKEVAHPPRDAHHVWLNDLLRAAPITDIPAIMPDTQVAVLQYTGGTTGVPKGASLSHSNLYILSLIHI